MSFYKTRKFQQFKHEKNKLWSIDDITKDFQCSKMFLTLHFNDFAFDWQLIKQHNLTKGQIQKYAEKLNELGLVSFRLLSELSSNMQEAIMSITPDFTKIYSQNPKVYIITPAGKTKWKKIVTNILKNIGANQGLYDLVQQLMKWSKSFRTVKQKIISEEKDNYFRIVKFPNGDIIEKDTKKKIDLLVAVKQVKMSQSTGTDLVLNDKNSELMLIQEVKEELKNKKKCYNGIYSNLNSAEISNLTEFVVKDNQTFTNSEGKSQFKISKKEEKIKLEHEKELNVRGHRELLIMQGVNINQVEKDKIFNEGMNFLNNLG